jgi:hypothetical protein
MSNIQARYIKEVKEDFIDRVKIEIKEKVSKHKSTATIAKHLKPYLYSILEKMPNSHILESDQQAEIVNKAYSVLHPVLEKRAKEEAPKPSIKTRFLSRSSFLTNALRKSRKVVRPSTVRNSSMKANNSNSNMNSMMRALNGIKL